MGPRASNKPNLRVCPPSSEVAGLDVSHWDGAIDWVKVKAQNNHFAFIKATEGTGYIDDRFTKNWANAKSAGFMRGAYHFFRANRDGHAQADLFLRMLGGDLGELPCVLDFESHDGMSIQTQLSRAQVWLDTVEHATKKVPIVYASPGFINDLNNPQGLYKYPLWVANYGVQCPNVPPPWEKWMFWQDSEKGRIPGISTNVDINVYNGNLTQLKAMTL